MQMLAEEILPPLSGKPDRRIAGLAPISNFSFNSHMNGFLLDEALLQVKLPQSNPYLSELVKDRAEELLKNLEDSKSTAGQVEGLLRSSLHTGEADMENIARKLGLSRHTLFRKLRAEGVTFAKILDELRYKMALQYLGKQKMAVNETAYLLGFSDPAAFSRAFKLTRLQALDRIQSAYVCLGFCIVILAHPAVGDAVTDHRLLTFSGIANAGPCNHLHTATACDLRLRFDSARHCGLQRPGHENRTRRFVRN